MTIEDHYPYLATLNEEQQSQLWSVVKQRKDSLHSCIFHSLAAITEDLGLEQATFGPTLADMLDTFSLSRPVPSLSTSQWRAVTVVLLESLAQTNELIWSTLHPAGSDKFTKALTSWSLRPDELEELVISVLGKDEIVRVKSLKE